MRAHVLLRAIVITFVATFSASVEAQIVPSGFTRTGVSSPSSATCLCVLPDGRYLIAQQTGQIRVWKNGVLLANSAHSLAVASGGEAGLIGMTTDPDFEKNGFVYIQATVSTPSGNRAKTFRFTLPPGSDVAEAGSQIELFDCGPSSGIHNGGALHFGPNGKLYIAVGDRGNSSNAQNLTTLSGKMLRINSDGTIPTDNPFFASAADANRAIWCRGLRNPYTFAFHPTSGLMYINDVGSGWEEINDGRAGLNYGWPTVEGPFNSKTFPAFQNPLLAFNGSSQPTVGFTGRTVIGATFYSALVPQFPESYRDGYFFGSYNNGWVRWRHPTDGSTQAFASSFNGIVDLDVDLDGSLLVLQRTGLQRISFPIPAGACCTGSACEQMLVNDCASAGGRFFGVAEACPAEGMPCCPADLSEDGQIDLVDLVVFLNRWQPAIGTTVPQGGPLDYRPDGSCNLDDLVSFLDDWSPAVGLACP